METDILRSDHVVKILGGRVIIYDAHLSVKQGEIFGLIGPSGSGKTTLLRTLSGFFRPDKGDVYLRSSLLDNKEDELFTSVSDEFDSVKQVIGFASQHPSIYMELTADENLDYFGALQGVAMKDVKKRKDILLQLMDLTGARKTRGFDLSGGMQRRLDIACAMIHQPKLLILDEPTADLDPFLRKNIWDLIRKINDRGTTVIVSSHELADVERICDRVALVYRGRILHVNDPDIIKREYITHERIRLQTYPGHYKSLIRAFEKYDLDIFEEGQQLIITTTDVQETIPKILLAVGSVNESITTISVESSSLDQVFETLGES